MNSSVIQSFTDRQAARLTGASEAQLRAWDRTAFYHPEFACEDRKQPYSRIYSFRDLVSLRVLNDLRNTHRVSLQHLRKVAEKLSHLGSERWTASTLYVLNRKVIFDDETGKREIVSGQQVFDIPLSIVAANMKEAVRQDQERPASSLGRITRHRHIMGNSPVFAGTRVPVATVIEYLDAGYTAADILAEYPTLTERDIEAARGYKAADAA